MWQKSNLICIKTKLIQIPNFKSISQRTIEKSSENQIFKKANNSSETRSNVTIVELDLYYVKTNSYTKFQVNISKDNGEKFGKPSGRTLSRLTDRPIDRGMDRLTDSEETYRPPPPPGFYGRGLKIQNIIDLSVLKNGRTLFDFLNSHICRI